MAKHPRYFSSGDTMYRMQSTAPQVIWSDQLEIRCRELQELREAGEAEEQSTDGPTTANK